MQSSQGKENKLNETTFQQEPLPHCNMLWVGPPCDYKTLVEKDRSGVVINQDINKILVLAKQIQNPLDYWCLDAYVDTYVQRFSKAHLSNVKVHSIEKYLEECLSSDDPFIKEGAAFLLQFKKEILETEGRGKIVDYITIKDVFALYLLATRGGYTLDSNVELRPDKNSLPAFSDFQAPNQDKLFAIQLDCWAMYAPSENKNAKNAFDEYKEYWAQIQKKYARAGYSPAYQDLLVTIMMGCVNLGFAAKHPKERTSEHLQWEYQEGNNKRTATIKALGIKKTFHNTHKSADERIRNWMQAFIRDSVAYFQERYFNEKDLKAILQVAMSVDENKPLNCISYLQQAVLALEERGRLDKPADGIPTQEIKNEEKQLKGSHAQPLSSIEEESNTDTEEKTSNRKP